MIAKEKLREIVKKAVSDSWHIGNAFDPIEDQTEHITEALHQALSMSGVVGRSEQLACKHKFIDNYYGWNGVRKCLFCNKMEE